MMSFPFHIVIAPILLPLITAALLLFFDERQRVAKAAISLTSTVLLLAVAILLFREVNSTVNTEIAAVVSSGVYLLGNWPAPFGIVLVADRLSGLMVLLTALLAIPSLIYSFVLLAFPLGTVFYILGVAMAVIGFVAWRYLPHSM